MNRVLLTTSMMTPMERLAGRFMRAPDHPTGGGDGTGTTESNTEENNTGGNSGDSGNEDKSGDNSGQETPLEGFWDGKPEEKPASDSDSTEASQQLGGELKSMIEGFAPPAPVFNEEVAKQIAEGDFTGANEAIRTAHHAAMKVAVQASAKMIGAVVQRLQADFETRINSALGNKDNADFLKQHFPQAKNPTLAPMVERVWNQALVNTKGNRDEALKQTRGMLQAMGSEFAPDDIRQPPNDPTGGINTPASKSLVEDLLSRT